MINIDIDESTKEALNNLSWDEVSHYSYGHEILWYGIDSVVHVHMMRMARDVAMGKITRDEFIRKYGLDFEVNKICGSLRKVEEDGIFIPKHKYLDEDEDDGVLESAREEAEFLLFDLDYFLIGGDEKKEREYNEKLISKEWQPSDLENIELIELGIKCGQYMWGERVLGYQKSKNGRPADRRTPVNIISLRKNVQILAEKLIEYYSSIVYNPTN